MIVHSTELPLTSRYRATFLLLTPKKEIIDSLFQMKRSETDSAKQDDVGVFRKLVLDFYYKTGQKPEQIIIFRSGVGESRFNEVLNIEFDQILRACKNLDGDWPFKFTIVVAQQKHHTRFFRPDLASSSYNVSWTENVSPGVVVDTEVCHPQKNDFYMCAHATTTGTTKPTHYHVLHDDMGYTADELQELVHSLSYDCQRSTTALSTVSPIYYAQLAASQMAKLIKFDDIDITSITRGFGELRLHAQVDESMFFC